MQDIERMFDNGLSNIYIVFDYNHATKIYSCRSAMGNKHMAGAVEV